MEQQPAPPPSALPYGTNEPPSALGALWLCGGLGLLILYVFPRTLQWLMHATLGTHFDPFLMPDGTEVPYLKTQAFWSDLGPTTLALMFIVEGLSFLFVTRRSVLLSAATLIALFTLYNLGYLIMTFLQGLALMSAVAVFLGVPAIVDLFRRAKRTIPFADAQNSA